MSALLAWDKDLRRSIEQDCRACSREGAEGLRQRWGCDTPMEIPWVEIECFACDERSTGCAACNDTRCLPLYDCPWTYVGERERFVLQAALFLEAGISPMSGPPGDWPATFSEALQIVCGERAELMRKEFEKD